MTRPPDPQETPTRTESAARTESVARTESAGQRTATPTSEAGAGAPPAAGPSDSGARSWIGVRLAFAGKAFVITSLLAVAFVFVRGSLRHKATQPRHLVDLAVWNVVDRPRWSTLDDVREIRAASGLVGRGLPLYDRSAAELAEEALVATPRAKRVLSVIRVPPDQVEVVMEIRRPVAAVALSDGRYVEVDADGVVLDAPSPTRPVRGTVPLRVVSGSPADVPAAGGTCSDDVRDGLRLCGLLDGYREGRGEQLLRTFDEVDVANHGGRVDRAASELVLRAAPTAVTGDGAVPRIERPIDAAVEWGRLGEQHGEPPFEAKARKLESAVRVFGDFAGISRVRVAFAELSVVPVDGPEGAWLEELSEQTRGR